METSTPLKLPLPSLMGMPPSELKMPFGLKLGHSTRRDVEKNFVVTEEQGKGFTDGPIVQVIGRERAVPGSEYVVLAFDEEGKLDAAWFTLDAEIFEEALQALDLAFELVNSNSPIKGSRSALYIYEDGEVSLNAPLFSHEMTLGYRTKKFNQARMAVAAQEFE